MKQRTEELLLDVHERLYEQYIAMEAIELVSSPYSNGNLFATCVQNKLISCALDIREQCPQGRINGQERVELVRRELALYSNTHDSFEDMYTATDNVPEEIHTLSGIYVQDIIDEIIDDDQKI